jgi:hypothetical protein
MPDPRGPVSEHLLDVLGRPPHDLRWNPRVDPRDEEDLQLSLYCLYELHYTGLPGVEEDWEWEPSLLRVRRALETGFEAGLREAAGRIRVRPQEVVPELWRMATSGGGPSLSEWVCENATIEQFRELAKHRSAYQLKEADPHTWAIPRLRGEAKAVMVEIQADEYGSGSAGAMHSALFAKTMVALGLDPTPLAYVDELPAATLATTNLISFLGLHRRLRGALVGHLALFEMTSVGPMGRYAAGLRRLGLADEACEFYDVHVQADEIHQRLATDGMVAGFLRDEPALAGDVLFGARALEAVEARFAQRILACWQGGGTSLREAGVTERPAA